MVKVVVIVLAVVGALALTCFGSVIVGTIWLANKIQPPQGITVQVAQPATILEGDTFDIVITVTDTLGRARTIMDIDFYDPLLKGLQLVSVTPPHQDFDPALGFGTFTMNASVPPNGSTTVTFRFVATTVGEYTADLDVSIDSIFSLDSREHTINIVPAAR
jgi:hypothetical protein